MQGKVTGVNIVGSSGSPGAGTRIVIRGASSFSRNNQPLYVIDGIPFNNDSYSTEGQLVSGSAYSNRGLDIDPNDIASMSVLKGLAATALYGERAAAGAIIITTKSGKGGSAKKGMEVTYRLGYAIETISKLPSYQKTYGQGGDGIYSGTFLSSWGPAYSDITDGQVPDWKGNTVPFQFYSSVEDFFRTGGNLDNSITVSGGGEKSNLSATFSNSQLEGFIPNTNFNRTNLKLGGNTFLDNGLYISGSLSYMKSTQTAIPQGATDAATANAATAQLWYMPTSLDLYRYPYENEKGLNQHYRATFDHPLFGAYKNPYTSDVNRIFTTTKVGYDITKWLSAEFRVGYDSYSQVNTQTYAPSSQAGGQVGAYIEDRLSFQAYETYFSLNFNKNITEDINLKAIVGHNVRNQSSNNQSLRGTGFVAQGISDLDNLSSVVAFGGQRTETALVGVYADITLGYRNYLFLNLTGRNDWSSTLPKDGNSFFYPSVSTSFVFTDAFDIKSEVLTFGKLRAAVSQAGVAASAYATNPLALTPNQSYGNNLSGLALPFKGVGGVAVDDGGGNIALEPEITTEIEVGTELGFLKNSRIIVDFSYYNRVSKGQIYGVAVAPSSGLYTQQRNSGEVRNKGIELGVTAGILRLPFGLNWDMNVNFTRNRSMVEKLSPGLENLPLGGRYGNLGVYAVPGQPYGVVLGTRIARDDEGNALINPATGLYIPTNSTDLVIADPNPDFIMGVNNAFSYKGLRLSFLIDWKQGGQIYSNTLTLLRGRGISEFTDIDRSQSYVLPGVLGNPATGEAILNEDGQTIENTTYLSAWDYHWRTGDASGIRELGVYDATVIRLREITLNYTLPKSLLGKLPIGSVSIGAMARNLWFFTPNIPKEYGFDPETSSLGIGNSQGLDTNYMPSNRRYGFNLSVTF